MMNILQSSNTYSISLNQINALAKQNSIEFVKDVENSYTLKIDNIAKNVLNNDVSIIMLSGPSAGGKTTTAKMIHNALKNYGSGALIISLDDFYLENGKYPLDENGNQDFESIHALDLPLLIQSIKNLLTFGYYEIKRFNFRLKRREDTPTRFMLPKGHIAIFEGLHALNPLIVNAINSSNVCKLYVSVGENISMSSNFNLTGADLRFLRRIVRDTKFRHVNAEFTFNIWNSVCNGEEKYVKPYKSTADIIIKSIHYYEPCVVGKMSLPILSAVEPTSNNYAYAQKFIKEVNKFETISAGTVPQSSLLREFIGDGIYSY